MSQLHIIYVPGIGDHKTYGQDVAIKLWCLLGVHGHYHAVGWAEGNWETKLQKLLTEIDGYLAVGHRVGLVGFSAGATAVLNAFAMRRKQISGVVCVSGKIQHPETVGLRISSRNTAFIESLAMLQPALRSLTDTDKARLRTAYPKADQVVALADATISGVSMWRTPGTSHMASIIWNLLPGSFKIVNFFRQCAASS